MVNRSLSICLFVFCCHLWYPHTALAQDSERLQAWFAANMTEIGVDADAVENSEEFDSTQLGTKDIAATTDKMWKAYKAAAIEKGWDKILPKTFDMNASLEEDEARPSIQVSNMKAEGDLEMPCCIVQKGERPNDGWPLFIAMHGGGKYFGKEKLSGPHSWTVNSREFKTQVTLSVRLYKPAANYFVPRMADDNRGRWFHKHNIEIFDRVIRNSILFNDVDPNRVYIMGISQGGYGTGHLAPLLADRFAAAGSMAGGMSVVAENLRNVPFRSDIGEGDTMYDRIKLAKEAHARLDELRQADPGGYLNELAIQKGRGHGIDYSKSPSWLATQTRNSNPDRIVWRCHAKDSFYNENFYWLSVTNVPKSGEYKIVGEVDREANQISITAHETDGKGDSETSKPLKSSNIIVHLNDTLVDLDKPVKIFVNDKEQFADAVPRSATTLARNLLLRGDPNYAFPARVTISLRD